MLVNDPTMDDNKLLDTSSSRALVEYKQLISEMRSQNFDVIRFATYRTACKLKFIQRKTNLHLVDLWNIIESFRENQLNGVDLLVEINVSRLESAISSIYRQLNKRLPAPQQINMEASIALLLNWLLSVYDSQECGKIRVFSVKVALALMCSGKLMDKLRYIFSLIADQTTGFLMLAKFDLFLKECLALPTAMYEGPSFGYSANLAKGVFTTNQDSIHPQISVNDFLDTLLADPGPQCLLWLPILHRMALVEGVFHPVKCEACQQESFLGFRYKCQRCYNYHLCQDCFWRGRTSGNHTNNHEMKEYCSYKNPGKALSHSLRKSFRTTPPANSKPVIPRFPETPEKTPDGGYQPSLPPSSNAGLKNGVSSIKSIQEAMPSERQSGAANHLVNSANQSRDARDSSAGGSAGKMGSLNRYSGQNNGGGGGGGGYGGSNNRRETTPSGGSGGGGNSDGGASRRDPTASRVDEEHRLIARYAARLANTTPLLTVETESEHETAGKRGSPQDLSGCSGEGSGGASDSHRSPSGAASDDASSVSGGSIFNLSDTTRAQRELICQLEAKNRQIMSEIQRLRIEQEATAAAGGNMFGGGSSKNPALIAELRLLRQRKDELEGRMTTLQESRRELMVQLEGLMKLLKNQTTSSPRASSGYATASGRHQRTGGSNTPVVTAVTTTSPQGQNEATLTGLGGDVRQAFGELSARQNDNHHLDGGNSTGARLSTAGSTSGSSRTSKGPLDTSTPPITTLRSDLLVAADSVTSAMSSLVKELNSESFGRGGEEERHAGGLDIAMLAQENMILSQRERQRSQERERMNSGNESGGGGGGGADSRLRETSSEFETDEGGNRLTESKESGTSPCSEYDQELDVADGSTSPLGDE